MIEKSNILEVSNEVIFSTVITISIFVLGYILNQWIERINKNIRLSKFYKFFIYRLDSFIRRSSYQFESLNDFANSFETWKFRRFTAVPTLEFEFFSESKYDFYSIVFYRIKNKNINRSVVYNKIIGSIEVIRKTLISVEKLNNESKTEIDKLEDYLNAIRLKIYQELDIIRISNKANINEIQIFEIIKNSNQENAETLYQTVIQPIEKHLIINKMSKHSKTLSLITEFNNTYHKLKYRKTYYGNLFKSKSKEIEKYVYEIDKCYKEISSSKVKRNFW